MRAATLARIEWFKARRRVAFWLAVLFFFGFMLVGVVAEYYVLARRPEQITDARWSSIVSAISGLGLLVMLVTIVLLTASEKSWKTERQNVIDGLSRTQYFAGKLMLTAAFALFLWVGSLLFGAALELLSRSLVVPAWPFLGSDHVLILAGCLLYLGFVGTIALFFGTIASSSGAALALAFLFLFAQAPIMFQMAQQGGAWQEATAWLPAQVLSALTSQTAYDADELLRLQGRIRESGLPLTPPAGRAALLALLYGSALAAGAWWSIRRRDL
jgi:ABC-type transport system involved in multi-copper enzyme maturation permease subunit